MRWPRSILALMGLLAACGLPGFAATEYVIVNNGNYISNSAVLYELNTQSGKLTKTGVLHTGGQGDMYESNLSMIEVAVTPDAGCVFVLDDGSSDIAAFSKAAGYKRVGDYFNANVIAGSYGGSLSLTPDGKFLYGGYGYTENVGAWAVGPTCTLAFLSAYGVGGFPDQARTTPNGRYLLVSGSPFSLQFGINEDGSLRSVGYLHFTEGACSRITFCTPHGLDITKDSKFAVFASNAVDIRRQYSVPVALTARITSTGLVNPRAWVLKNSATLAAATFPFFARRATQGWETYISGSRPEEPVTARAC